VSQATPGPRGRTAIPRPPVDREADGRFYARAERYLDGTLKLNPYLATLLGYHDYDHLLDDLSPEGVAGRVAFYREARRDFERFEREDLGTGAAIDRDLILADVASTLFGLEELRSHERDPQVYNEIIGFGTLYLTILEPGSDAWPERLDALLSRMDGLPRFLDDARRNLREPADVVTRFIIEQNRGNIAFFEKTAPALFATFPALKARFERALPRTLQALGAYQSFLEGELLARSTGDWRLGADLWSRKLHHVLQSDMTPAEIEQRAWEHLTRQRQEMLELALPMHDRMFPSHKHREQGDDRINAIVREVLDQVSIHHSAPDRLLEDCRKWVAKARAFIAERDLITLPPEKDNFVIEPTPAFLDGMAVAFFNPAPAFEPHMKKSFWVSSIPKTGDAAADAARAASYLREYNDYGLQNLVIHEAFPGHYVQFYHALASPIASIYKKVFASLSFAEGWAVLCEEQMFDEGYGGDGPEAMLVHRKMALRAPLNAILDARLHTGRMDDAEADRWALDLMRRFGFQEEAEAVGKLRRAKVSSTQLSTYFVGFVELADLMAEYRRAKGDAFSLKEFNERLLSYGTIPPRAVRKLMLGV